MNDCKELILHRIFASNFSDINSLLNNYCSGEFEFRITNKSTLLNEHFEVFHTDIETCDRILNSLKPKFVEDKVELVLTYKKTFPNKSIQFRKINEIYEKKTLITMLKATSLPLTVKLSKEEQIPPCDLKIDSYQKRHRISYHIGQWKIDKTFRYISNDPNDSILDLDNKYYTLLDLEFEYTGYINKLNDSFFTIIGIIFDNPKYNLIFTTIERWMGKELIIPPIKYVTKITKSNYKSFSYINYDNHDNWILIIFGDKKIRYTNDTFQCDYGKLKEPIFVYSMRDNKPIELMFERDSSNIFRLPLEQKLVIKSYEDIINKIAFNSEGYYIIPSSFTFNAFVIYENGYYIPYVIIDNISKIITKDSLFNEDSIRHLGYSLFKTTYENCDNIKNKLCKYVSIMNDDLMIKSNDGKYHNKIVQISNNSIICESEFISHYSDVILSEVFEFKESHSKLVIPTYLSSILCNLSFVDVLYIFDSEYYSIIDNTFINNLYLTNMNSDFIEMLMNKNKCSQIFNLSKYNHNIVDVIIVHKCDFDLSSIKLKENGKLIVIGFDLPEEPYCHYFDELFYSKDFSIYELV
jgi:hypothetical protein